AGMRFVWYSGRPRDPILDSSTTTTPGNAIPGSSMPRLISRSDLGRLPGFYRIDLRLEKRWRLGETGWISFVIEALNATLRKEIVSENCNVFIDGTIPGAPPVTTRTCRDEEIG